MFKHPLWLEWRGLIIFLIIMVLFRSAVADWNQVPTGSMRPTILDGDRVVVNKLAYRLRFPLTDWELAHSMGLLIRLAAHPERLKAIQGEESLQLPVSFSDSYSDSLGNPISRLRLNAGIHTIEYRLSAAQPCFGAGLDPLLGFTPLSELPTDTLVFLQPSRYVDSDRLGTAAFEVVEGAKKAGE